MGKASKGNRSVQCVLVRSRDLEKKQQAGGLLSKLGWKTPLRRIPLLGDILF